MIYQDLINHLMMVLQFAVLIHKGQSGQNRIEFKVIDHIGAGSVSDKLVGDHEAVRIMTGAQIPNGADAVVMFEQTIELEDTFTIRKPFSKMKIYL